MKELDIELDQGTDIDLILSLYEENDLPENLINAIGHSCTFIIANAKKPSIKYLTKTGVYDAGNLKVSLVPADTNTIPNVKLIYTIDVSISSKNYRPLGGNCFLNQKL